ncbi:hypothetical protein F5Y04DRAFT_256716 [Hypomontagnella monticulosa]|nr:hypothetical protein F5Y04DRAFT_256716 [Hypomontagnella monticulosa]
MTHELAIKWACRTRQCLRVSRIAYPRSHHALTLRGPRQHQKPSHIIPYSHSQHRSFSSTPPRCSGEAQPPPAGNPGPQQSSRKRGKFRSLLLFNAAGLSALLMVAIVLRSANSSNKDGADAIMNTTSFSPFIITAKEQVSPTAFVLSVRAGDATSGGDGDGRRGSRLLSEAWKHGLWSVEVKQPQLQIARHYTPLPPSSTDENEELRFLVRKVDGGEMSTYLSKQGVGDKIWLRGPHFGFDVARRLGDAKNVVFLAGGTGVAPALQIAQRLLEDPDSTSGSGDSEVEGKRKDEKPTISILWANRRAADALGRQSQQPSNSSTGGGSWFTSLWRAGNPSTAAPQQPEIDAGESSLAQQIHALQRNHPGHFHIEYFVDEERYFITDQDIRATLTSFPPSSSTQPLLPTSPSCPWHARVALESLPDDNDSGRHNLGCACARQSSRNGETGHKATGANLVCVSGPDGFIAALAGPKRWHGGGEMQGSVGGVLGELIQSGEMGGKKGENWLVLKL